jgi:adenine-specific DNA-methyltransferase
MNEIFGEESFLACFVWQRRQVPDNRNLNNVSTDHEYVLAYAQGSGVLTGTAKDLAKYSNPDDDPRGPWMSDNLTGLANREQRPNLHYNLVNPATGTSYPPSTSRGWAYDSGTSQGNCRRADTLAGKRGRAAAAEEVPERDSESVYRLFSHSGLRLYD